MNEIVDFPGRARAPVVQLVRTSGSDHYGRFCHHRREMLSEWRQWVETRREDLDPVIVLDEMRATVTALESIVDLANTWSFEPPPNNAA